MRGLSATVWKCVFHLSTTQQYDSHTIWLIVSLTRRREELAAAKEGAARLKGELANVAGAVLLMRASRRQLGEF